MAKYDEIQDAVAVVRGTGNMISDKKIYIKARQLETGEPGATSMGLKGWGAVDFLCSHGYNVVYEMSQTREQSDNSY